MPNPPSERRLHPLSFLFEIASHGREMLLPGIFVLIAGARGSDSWQIWVMVLFVPYALAAVARSLRRSGTGSRPDELVIRSGLIFRQQRARPVRTHPEHRRDPDHLPPRAGRSAGPPGNGRRRGAGSEAERGVAGRVRGAAQLRHGGARPDRARRNGARARDAAPPPVAARARRLRLDSGTRPARHRRAVRAGLGDGPRRSHIEHGVRRGDPGARRRAADGARDFRREHPADSGSLP